MLYYTISYQIVVQEKLFFKVFVRPRHWRIYIQNFPAHPSPPPRDPILSILHTFSLKSSCVRGPHPSKTSPRLPYGKSWIRPCEVFFVGPLVPCFGLQMTLPISFKVRVDRSSPVLFCGLHSMIPRVISGCRNRASYPDDSPRRQIVVQEKQWDILLFEIFYSDFYWQLLS